MTAQQWMNDMYFALGDKLVHPDGPYYGRKMHLRLAKEIGYALPDFEKKEQDNLLKSSYSMIYVKACLLKPLLSAKQWTNGLIEGRDIENRRRDNQRRSRYDCLRGV